MHYAPTRHIRNVLPIYIGLLSLLSACNLSLEAAPSPISEPGPLATFEFVNADPTQVASLDPAKCYFFGYGIGAPFPSHTGPDLANQETTGILVDVDAYEIVTISEDRYQVNVESEGIVWVNRRYGTSQGTCDTVAFVQTRSESPDGICTIRYNFPEDFPLRDDPNPEHGTTIGTMPWGEYIEIIGTVTGASDAYKVRLPDGPEGYVSIPSQSVFYNGIISGPCDELPVETDTRPGG